MPRPTPGCLSSTAISTPWTKSTTARPITPKRRQSINGFARMEKRSCPWQPNGLSEKRSLRQLVHVRLRAEDLLKQNQQAVNVSGHKLTDFIPPMLAKEVGQAFSDKDWIYEMKYDGFRAIAEVK